MTTQQPSGKPGRDAGGRPGAAEGLRAEVAKLRARGVAVCKVGPGTKSPSYKGWSTNSLEADAFGPDDLVGIIGGPLSDCNRPGHALVRLDLDSAEAVGLADDYLPPTGMEEGRPGKPRSHRDYLVPCDTIPDWAHSQADQAAPAARKQKGHPGPFTKSFRPAETREEVLRFIGTGGQAVCPPSPHPGGELREWVGGGPGEPAAVPFEDLWLAVCLLADACGCDPASGTEWPWAEASGRADPPPPSSPFRFRTPPKDSVEYRATRYLGTIEGAESKRGGHAKTFWAARVVVWRFGLGAEVGFAILNRYYNPRCKPEWSDAELWHKCLDAGMGGGKKFRPTKLMERVSRVVEEARPTELTRNDVLKEVKGKAQYVREAINCLIREGFLATRNGPRNSSPLTLIKPFREVEFPTSGPDDVFDLGADEAGQTPTTPTASRPRPDRVRDAVPSPQPRPRPTASPPTRGDAVDADAVGGGGGAGFDPDRVPRDAVGSEGEWRA